MKGYITKRVLQLIPVLIIILSIVFLLMYITGDPVILMLPEDATEEQVIALQAALNLDQPLYMQYGTFMWNALAGDFGKSFTYNTDAMKLVIDRIPATLTLALGAMIIAVLIAIPFGVMSAIKRNSFLDLFISSGTILGKAMPNFWIGIMLILFFAVNFNLLPVSGMGSWKHLVLPSITLGVGISADIARLTRSSILEVLNQDYVRTAKSKGTKFYKVILFHVLRNALVPIVTIVMMQTTTIVGGAIVTEMIFAWPGLGQLLVQSINARDMSVVQASIFVIALMVIIINLITDIICGKLDPRIKYN